MVNMTVFTKKKNPFTLLAFLALAFVLTLPSALLAQYERYSGYEDFDPEKRMGLFHVSSAVVQIQGIGFRDVQISDYERTPMDSSDIERADVALSESNYDDFRAGISIGFITMKKDSYGGGFEFEYIGFENPIIIQYAVFLNYGIWAVNKFLLGPYAKIGSNKIDVLLAKAQTKEAVRLSEVERLQGENPVDVYDGNELKTESEAIYAQFGLQLIYRFKANLALYFQLGYQNEIDITKELRLNIEGRRTNLTTGREDTASSTLDFDDRALVEPNTDTPARLAPELKTGPLYFSVGVGYPFDFD